MMSQSIVNIVVDITVSESAWLTLLTKKQWQRHINKVITSVASLQTPWPYQAEVNIVLTHDDAIQQLNAQYRGHNKPTNVLSFGFLEKPLCVDNINQQVPILLGDIILSWPTLQREAMEQNKAFKDHLYHMLIHGWLHLLGYDHENDHDANTMETIEITLLNHLGINNPYLINNV